MCLVDRRPEWDEQHLRDLDAYGLRLHAASLNEFSETHPPESGEHGYRRGYGDGWLYAVEMLWNLLHGEGLTLEEAYQVMRQFGTAHGPLRKWAAGDCREMELPPNLGVVSVGKEVRAKRKQGGQ